MGLNESLKVTKAACRLPLIQGWDTCLLIEPGLDLCPKHPLLWAGARPLHSQPRNPKVGSFPPMQTGRQRSLRLKRCFWAPPACLESTAEWVCETKTTTRTPVLTLHKVLC